MVQVPGAPHRAAGTYREQSTSWATSPRTTDITKS